MMTTIPGGAVTRPVAAAGLRPGRLLAVATKLHLPEDGLALHPLQRTGVAVKREMGS